MDPEPPPSASKSSTDSFAKKRLFQKSDRKLDQEDDPYSLNGPSIALVGLSVSIGMLGIPLLAVFYDRPAIKENIENTVLERDGSKFSPSIPFSRFSKPSS